MIWYGIACVLLVALLCLIIGATKLSTPAIAAIDVVAMLWLLVIGGLVLMGWSV